MFPSTAVLSLLLAVLSSATPVQRDSNRVTLHFAHQVNALCGSQNLAELDRDRATALLDNAAGQKTSGKVVSVDVTNTAVTYTSQVGIGSPPVDCESANRNLETATTDRLLDKLLIDTGSSNTWVQKERYVKTKTSKEAGSTVVCIFCSSQFMSLIVMYLVCVLRQRILFRN
jgi:hypothetical protein